MKSKKPACLLLAAGAATRFGSLKQLSFYQDKTLLEWALHHAREAKCSPIYVVTGNEADRLSPVIEYYGAREIYNPDWEEGLPTSVKAGIQYALEDSDWDQLFVLPADLPWFTEVDYLNFKVASTLLNKRPSVTAIRYRESIGIPALMPREFLVRWLRNGGSLRKAMSYARGLMILPPGRHTQDVDYPEDLE